MACQLDTNHRQQQLLFLNPQYVGNIYYTREVVFFTRLSQRQLDILIGCRVSVALPKPFASSHEFAVTLSQQLLTSTTHLRKHNKE